MPAADAQVDDLLPFTDPAFWHDPYPYYERARAAGPVYASPAGVHVVLGHADVVELLRDPRLSARELSFGVGDTFHDSVLGQDPPDHTRLRRVFHKWFTAARVREWTADTQARLDAALAAAEAGDGRLDLIDDYAFPATFGTISTLFGVAVDEAVACRHHTYVIGRALAPGATDDDGAAGLASIAWYADYVRGLIATKRRSPGDDLLSAFIAACDDGTMSEAEVLATMTLLYAVGHLDNTYLIANGVIRVLADPALRQRYVDDPTVRLATVQELLRHETPEQFVVRAVTEDIDVRGAILPAGGVVMLMVGAANRDPAVFPDPERIDIDRPNLVRQVAFGGGIHACIGSSLARAQGEAGITAIVERFPGARVEGEVEYDHTEFLRVIRHATVRLGERAQ